MKDLSPRLVKAQTTNVYIHNHCRLNRAYDAAWVNRALGNIWDSKNPCLAWNSLLELLQLCLSNSVHSSQGRLQHFQGLSE